MTEHFMAEEFFKGEILKPELEITKLFAAKILEPLRLAVNTPIVITSGWRSVPITTSGSAGATSDHNILAVNPKSSGAVDIYGKGLPVKRLFLTLASMIELGDIADLPREILWESRGGSEWLHVAYPPQLKDSEAFKEACGEHTDWLKKRGPAQHRYRRIILSSRIAESWPINAMGQRIG